MRLEDIKIWLDLVETRSFSKCAQLNFLTQPAVSQKIKHFENEFGMPLLVRGGKSFNLTAAGKIFYEESQKIAAQYQALSSRIRSLSGTVQGTLKVASIYSIGLYELNTCLKHFMKKYPRVDLNLEFSHSPKIYQDLLEGRIEVGFVAYPKEQPRLKIIPFSSDHLILVTPPRHPLSRFRRIDLCKINDFEFVGFKEDIPTRAALDEIFKKYRVQIKPVLEFDNLETIKQAVEIGAGISILPSITVKKEIQHGMLKGISFSNARFLRPLGMVVRSNEPLSSPAGKFVEEMAKSY